MFNTYKFITRTSKKHVHDLGPHLACNFKRANLFLKYFLVDSVKWVSYNYKNLDI